MIRFGDRAKDTSTTTGTGAKTLDNAPATGFVSFASLLSDGDQVYAAFATAETAAEWEVGLYTYAANVLTPVRVFASSNSNNAVNFSAGTRDVWIDYPAFVPNNTPTLGQAIANTNNMAMP